MSFKFYNTTGCHVQEKSILTVCFTHYIIVRLPVVSAGIKHISLSKFPAHSSHPKKNYIINVCVM